MLSNFQKRILSFDLIYFVICCLYLSLDMFDGIVLKSFLFLYILPISLLTGFSFLYEEKTKNFITHFTLFKGKIGIINIIFYFLVLIFICNIFEYKKYYYHYEIDKNTVIFLLITLAIRLLIYILSKKDKQFLVVLIDITQDNSSYIYTYFLPIGKKYYKLTFISHIPHIWWTEIQTMLKNIDIYSNIKQSINLPFGKLKIEFFNRLDLLKYKNFKNIDELLAIAIKKQMKFSDDYNQTYGHPDLSSLHT